MPSPQANLRFLLAPKYLTTDPKIDLVENGRNWSNNILRGEGKGCLIWSKWSKLVELYSKGGRRAWLVWSKIDNGRTWSNNETLLDIPQFSSGGFASGEYAWVEFLVVKECCVHRKQLGDILRNIPCVCCSLYDEKFQHTEGNQKFCPFYTVTHFFYPFDTGGNDTLPEENKPLLFCPISILRVLKLDPQIEPR